MRSGSQAKQSIVLNIIQLAFKMVPRRRVPGALLAIGWPAGRLLAVKPYEHNECNKITEKHETAHHRYPSSMTIWCAVHWQPKFVYALLWTQSLLQEHNNTYPGKCHGRELCRGKKNYYFVIKLTFKSPAKCLLHFMRWLALCSPSPDLTIKLHFLKSIRRKWFMSLNGTSDWLLNPFLFLN